jgi:non-specific serine/threonine protein kinase
LLLELVGRSDRTMVWRAARQHERHKWLLTLPREVPATPDQLAQWESAAQRAARLRHPAIAEVLFAGHHDGWPYLLHAEPDAGAMTLLQHTAHATLETRDAASMAMQLGEGLAYAHEAGLVHGDPQAFHVMLLPSGQAQWLAMQTAIVGSGPEGQVAGGHAASTLAQADRLSLLRSTAQRDVLALGLIFHRAVSGQWPLDEVDTGRVIARLPPHGRDIVRLPWSTPRPVPEALRAIANRATDRQERQRYRSARTWAHALDGWLRADANAGAGALAILMDRLSAAGVLPASPGVVERATRLTMMDKCRTSELAEVVLQDVALSLELIRAVNTARVRGQQISGSGPVLTVRRAIAMLGLNGVRRAASALRPWPGPLDPAGAEDLQRLLFQIRLTVRVADVLRPADWDSEVVAVVTLMQSIGALVIQYHFPQDAVQIKRLMQPGSPSERDGRPEPGMSEQAAAFAVLGIDVEAVGRAVARHWGLGEETQVLMRRMPLDRSLHPASSDDEFLRLLASCAHEVVATTAFPAHEQQAALARITSRYARALGLGGQSLAQALSQARSPGAARPALANAVGAPHGEAQRHAPEQWRAGADSD